MAKDDSNEIPNAMQLGASWVKRFFKFKFGIPVRVRSVPGRGGFVNVWIPCKRDERNLVYEHEFPPELGNACLRAVYPNSESMHEQNWGGNVQKHSIAMSRSQWVQVFSSWVNEPVS